MQRQQRWLIMKQRMKCFKIKNEKLRGEDSMQSFRMCFISRTWPYLPGQNLISASMHNRSRPFVPNAAGQSPYLSPGTDPPCLFYPLSSHSCTHKDTQGCRKAHIKTLTSPVFNTSFMLLFFPHWRCLFMSQEVMSEIAPSLSSWKKHNEVLFYREAITDNSEISLSIMQMYACQYFNCFN